MLTQNQCDTTVFIYFLREGWLPSGTDNRNWERVTMGEMGFDDPPLPADPNFQKRRISMDLQVIFFNLGSQLGDCFDVLSDDQETLRDLATWCHQHQH